MVDVLYVAIIIAFFGLMVAFVRWCEHIIGTDDAVDLPYDGIEDDTPPETTDRPEPASNVKTPEEVPS
jgi:hypothetical protein